MKSAAIANRRIEEIEKEFHAIAKTLSNLPETPHAEVYARSLIKGVEFLQEELFTIYHNYPEAERAAKFLSATEDRNSILFRFEKKMKLNKFKITLITVLEL